jgi:exodeoxyribonuclease V alpha subunit
MNLAPIPTPEQALAEGFAEHVVRWARESNAPERTLRALGAAARTTSLATSSGHVCTYLADVAAACELDERALREALLESGMVGTPQAPATRPLILDDDGRLYLHRYFDYERRLAQRLTELPPGPARPVGADVKGLLDDLFRGNAQRLGGRPDWQKIATALALERPLTIISGGPGTGKTTTVVNLLACVLAENPECRIRLAAPTGKAAARMVEAIRKAATQLPAPLRERLPRESFTVHRLLGVVADSGAFRHHAANPLPIDLLVVDEASMLDLALATRLIEAVPPPARIILLGDKDQLAAVESGAVFAELAADPTLSGACAERLSIVAGIPAARLETAAPIKPTGVHDSVVWLAENFRFARDSGIGRLAAHVNAGEAGAAIDFLRSGTDPAIEWIEDAHPAPESASLRRIVEGSGGFIDAARADLGDTGALFDALGRFRVLCAEREGLRGVVEINRFVERHFRKMLDHPLDPGNRSEWYPGRPVAVLRNDYVLRLFNGDVGIALPDATDSLMVFFPESDGRFRAVAPLRLPEHETAFATTVHKAQGSEFDQVLLMLPARPHRVVTRELLYTAVTRSRSRVTIVGGAEVVDKAIVSPTRRYSGLMARVEDLHGATQPAARAIESTVR